MVARRCRAIGDRPKVVFELEENGLMRTGMLDAIVRCRTAAFAVIAIAAQTADTYRPPISRTQDCLVRRSRGLQARGRRLLSRSEWDFHQTPCRPARRDSLLWRIRMASAPISLAVCRTQVKNVHSKGNMVEREALLRKRLVS